MNQSGSLSTVNTTSHDSNQIRGNNSVEMLNQQQYLTIFQDPYPDLIDIDTYLPSTVNMNVDNINPNYIEHDAIINCINVNEFDIQFSDQIKKEKQ
jgi:hypothetical protein